jgi:4-hydroxybenzoate polyprenyltransferase
MLKKIQAFFFLLRPANLLTSISDVWAGFAVSGAIFLSFHSGTTVLLHPYKLITLTLSVISLCAGTMVLADYFDIYLDTLDHPDKPLPKGILSSRFAVISGFSFLIIGIILSFLVANISGFIAIGIAILSLFYNVYGRYHAIIGPINMGLFRGSILLLGMSMVPYSIGFNFAVIFIPVVYIAAITSISRYEFSGISRLAIQLTGWLYLFVILYLLAIAFFNHNFFMALPFIVFLFFQIFIPITKAFKTPNSKTLERSVSQGIISLIILNASLAAAYSGILFGLIIISLLPISILLSRHYPVT